MDKTQNRLKPITVSKHIIYFDYLRIIAICAIVILHIATQNFHTVEINSYSWNIFNVYDSLTRWGVPIFVMISGALFLNKNQPIKKLYKKNILKTVVILLVWTLLYDIWQPLILHNNLSIKEFFIHLSTNPNYLWFLYMLIGLYMVVPFLKKIVENKKTMQYFLLLAFIFAFLIPELIGIVSLKSSFVANLIENKVASLQLFMILGFTGYFVLGHYLNKNNLTKKTEIVIYIFGILGLLFTILASLFSSIHNNELITFFYENMTINVAAMSVAVFVFFKNHFNLNDLTSKRNKRLQLLSRCSLGVYLTHVFIIDALNIFFNINSLSFNPILSIPLLSVSVLIISYCISIILYKIPHIGKWIV